MRIRFRCMKMTLGSKRFAASISVLVLVACIGAHTTDADAAPHGRRTRRAAATDALAGSPTVGTCHEGSLPGGVELPARTSALQRLGVVKERGTGFGSPRLVAFVLRTAQRLSALAAHASTPLRVGNLSLQGGGDMKWSHSHAAGRDVDFPLFVLDSGGRSISPDAYIHFDDKGNGRYRRRRVHFDVERNWNLVATLLSDPSVDVAHLYLAEPLRRRVLDYAAAQSADNAPLLARAREVLTEPSHAGRHDDHLHVRLLCSSQEIIGGCVDEDHRWAWAEDVSAALRQRVDAAAGQLTSPQRKRRIAALHVLAPWIPYDSEACRAVAWAAGYDRNASVRHQALATMRKDAAPCASQALLGAARAERTVRRAAPLLRRAVELADADDEALLTELLDDQPDGFRFAWPAALRSEIRAAAARRLAERPFPSALLALRRIVDDPDVRTRRTARQAIEVLANRRMADADAALGWARAQPRLAPLRWMLDGFAEAGLPVRAPASLLAPGLVEMLRGPNPVFAENAERLLTVLTGGIRLAHLPTPKHRYRAWARFWSLHGERYADRSLGDDPGVDASAHGVTTHALLDRREAP